MAPRFSSYEPLPGGRGYRLYGLDGSAQDFATTPAVDELVKALPPKPSASMLAQGGAGGGGAGGADGGDTAPPAPPPVVADAGYTSGEMVSRPPPPEPAPAAPTPAAPTLPPRAPPLAPQASGAEEPVTVDPTAVGASPMDPAEREWRALQDARYQQALKTPAGPIKKIPATWQAESRESAGKVLDPAALAEFDAAARAEAESRAAMAEEKAKADAAALDLERQRGAKDAEFQARQDASTRLFQEETARIEKELEQERIKQKDPKDFWASRSEGEKVALGIFMALGAVGGALTGDAGAAGRVIDGAMKAHMARREKNVNALVAKRGRGKEDFDLKNAALAAERATAMRQIDDQVKAAVAQGQNPILRELLEEDVAITPEAVEASLLKGATSDVGKDTAQKRMLFERGPNGELVPKEIVRYLAAEHEKNVARLNAARERLGIAGQFATSSQLRERFIPERTVGGGGGLKAAMDLREKQLKERMDRGEKAREIDIKAAGVVAPLATSRTKAAAEREEKEGARTIVYRSANGTKEYVARPGSSEKEMQTLRGAASDINAMREAIRILKNEESAKNKFVDNPRVEMASKAFAGLAGSTIFNSGIVNPSELESVVKTANNLGKLGPSGIEALEDMANLAEQKYRGLLEQTGAKPKGGK